MEEKKSREYYMAECDRLRSKLRACENRKYETLYFDLKKKIKTAEGKGIEACLQENEELKKKLSNLTRQLRRLKENIKENKEIKRDTIIKKLEKTNNLQKQEIVKIKLETNTYKDALKLLVHKNKQVMRKYFDNLAEEDEIRTKLTTIMLDFEYIFVFMKLFEMHLFDYIVERQNPDDKTEQDTKALIITCKDYSTKLIKSLVYSSGLDMQAFKTSLKGFVNQYVEER